MKVFRKKIGAILMTFVVLFSTMSFTVNQHYCGGELVASALFLKADSCGMEEKTPSKEDCNLVDKNCCDNVIKVYKGQKELEATNILRLNSSQQLFIASFIYTYINLFKGLENNIVPFKNYSPPILVTDIHIVDQVFLI